MGFLLRGNKRFPEKTSLALNGFILHISLPSLVLLHIHNLKFDSALLWTAFMPWMVFGLSFVFFTGLYFLGKIKKHEYGALVLTAGLGNTSFVGLPMLEALIGKSVLGLGILIDQLGTFLVLSTLGIIFASIVSGFTTSPKVIYQRILFFPPAQALVLAFLLRPLEYPDQTVAILQRLGDTLAPLALFSVGFQLNFKEANYRLLGMGLGFKLFMAPAVIYFVYKYGFVLSSQNLAVVFLEASMAPMITAWIVSVEFGFDAKLSGLMVGIGIPLSFVTSSLLYHFVIVDGKLPF